MNDFEMKLAESDSQIKEIADLAEIIWHEHFTPIIGEAQGRLYGRKIPVLSGIEGTAQKRI